MRPTIEFYPEIVEALKSSEGGISLENTYRWSRFRRGETNQRWRDALGATAQDMTHGQMFYGMGRVFLDYEGDRFSSEKQQIFLRGLLSHDWGEAIVNGEGVGDVAMPMKTSATEKAESVVARKVIDSLSLPVSVKNQLLSGYEQTVEGGDQELHQAYKALERTEYATTAIKVFLYGERQRSLGLSGIEAERLLVGRVLVTDMVKVMDVCIPRYPQSIGRYFMNLGGVVGRMSDQTLNWLRETDAWIEKPGESHAMIDVFEQKWKAFCRR